MCRLQMFGILARKREARSHGMHIISWGSAANRRKTETGTSSRTRIECFQGPSLKYIANLDLAPRSAVQNIGQIRGRGNLQASIAAREVVAAGVAGGLRNENRMSLLFREVQRPALPSPTIPSAGCFSGNVRDRQLEVRLQPTWT
jgi:hypothetical protein